MEDRYLNLTLADVLDRAGVPRASFLGRRPDLGGLLDPVVINPGIDTTPPPAPQPGSTVPDDVRPGDLIEAEDWNLVLAAVRRLVPAVTADDGRIKALEARVAALEGQVARLGTPWWVGPGRRELTPFEKLMLDPEILQRVATKAEIVESITRDTEVRKILEARPELLENAVRSHVEINPNPVDPDATIASAPAGAVTTPAVDAGRATADAAEIVRGDATLRRLVTGSDALSSRFGIEARRRTTRRTGPG